MKAVIERFCPTIAPGGVVLYIGDTESKIVHLFVSHFVWECEVWIAEAQDHMIHFSGQRFLGPYPDVMPISK